MFFDWFFEDEIAQMKMARSVNSYQEFMGEILTCKLTKDEQLFGLITKLTK